MNESAAAHPYVIQRSVPTLIWGREDGSFHTRISLFNYYSLLVEERPITSTAHLYLFDESGREAAHAVQVLEPLGQWQCALSSLVDRFQGSIGVQLVPDFLPPLKHNKYVGTLFFATYWDAKGHADFTHETDRMRYEDDHRLQYEPTVIPSSPSIDTSVIVQNSYFGADPSQCDKAFHLDIRRSDGTSVFRKSYALEPRASVVLHLNELVPNIRHLLGDKPGSVHISGRHINQPLTWSRHASGDFNIHHF
ncbi:MAG TPA: hypothetical protein VFQ34_06585 [Nitrospiraceae bacterium]|jgi:hypothetical protein|nr:hypothetical protein [Nitrospiraceae bacterium]